MKLAVLVFPGSGGDVDMHHAVKEVLGANVEYVWHEQANLERFDGVLIPNGASYGNYLRPGALAKASPAIKQLEVFIDSGKPVLGVGNGFHILTEAHLLPGAFLINDHLKFQSGTVKLTVQNTTSCFTKEYEDKKEITIPFAHQFGTYYIDKDTLVKLKENNQIAFTYTEKSDSNNIAGVLNQKKNVLGILPLPERAVEEMTGGTDGLPLFKSILKGWSESNAGDA